MVNLGVARELVDLAAAWGLVFIMSQNLGSIALMAAAVESATRREPVAIPRTRAALPI